MITDDLTKELRDITKNDNFYVKYWTTQSLGIGYKDFKPSLFTIFNTDHESMLKLKHAIKAIEAIKGLVPYAPEEIKEAMRCVDMLQSHWAYNSLEQDIEEVINDKYIAEFNLPDNAKRALAIYTRDSIEKITEGSYTDFEGCTYNSMTLKEI